MGKILRSSLTLLFIWGVSLAAPHAQSAAPPRPESRLDVVMREWAKATDAVRSARYRFTQMEYDRAFGERRVKKGEVQVLKPDLLRVDWQASKQPSILLITKKTIHLFNSEMKMEGIWNQPADRSFLGEETPIRSFWEGFTRLGEAFQNNSFWIFSGLPVRDLPRRFDVKLAKEDKYYIYLDIQPRLQKHRSEFEKLRVVLLKKSFRVRQIWNRHVNGNEITLDFEKPDPKAKVTEESIRKGLPEGWKRIHYPEASEAPPEK